MANTNSRGARTRERLIGAATDVIREDGATSLTLSATAARADVGKGTLLYHFPTKEALVEGVVEHHLERTEAAVAALAAEMPGPSPWLRAFAAFHLRPEERAAGRTMFAALMIQPQLASRARERQRRWLDRAADDTDPAVALLVTLAVGGLWVADVVGTTPADDLLADALERALQLAG